MSLNADYPPLPACLKDLLWLIDAPDLIDSHFSGKPELSFLGWTPAEFLAWLNTLAEQPDQWPAGLKPLARQPLGSYHEVLWQLLLSQAPAIELLGHHLPIREEKRTLGELDFLYRHRPTNQIFHLEVAIKYYLGLPQSSGQPGDLSHWVGPAGRDTLGIKVAHTEQKQLPLSDTPLARQQLETLIPCRQISHQNTVIHKQLALPGVLFYPWHTPMPEPQRANRQHNRGWWLSVDDWPKFLDSLNHETRGQRLRKPHWLAPPASSQLLEQQTLHLAVIKHFKEQSSPLHLMLYSTRQGWQRIFLVNPQWQSNLIQASKL